MKALKFENAYIKRIAHAHNVDMNNLPSKEEIEQKFVDKAINDLATQKKSHYYRMSVWSGGKPLKFTFGDWDVTKQVNVEQAKTLGNKAFKLASQLQAQQFNVVLMGDRGVGKTSLALAMMNSLMSTNNEHAGKSGMFVSTAELLSLINAKYDSTDIAQKIRDIRRAMIEVDVLVLDDFGTEGGMTGHFRPVHKDLQDLMYQVSNARVDFDNNQVHGTTIVTTNNTKQQLKQMYEGKFIDRIYPKNPEHQLLFADMKGVRNV
ncbi:MAG: ATP-binding protein [Furfurilactobacillus sp.]|jgi:DNA replication protein DnaC|uniref:ATP-binding protein n=1 Tax=Furfurilactobacillus sp. TaxID=2767911 RepID=UPI00258F9CAA|nr:ATP-binding protein [Furfurilactobacillus sp.]MCH4010569.1 ATP-binding protein [Furfurilactobacillus sp.]MCH4036461.1 ATP-binding protein [Furfurilactobacillus sp.]MCH4114593.1 ATP-binding protein [Furfurilactobacillus sp.]MCH4133788.1 ATP-binding protein [Furfurilactobacillus sp.]MCI1340175.1 ATP-binding protein [Furfurilactobacillus sp.]